MADNNGPPWRGARRLAIANLKGGVGKSTAAMMLADVMTAKHGARVLLIDLDPQANASQMLLSPDGLMQQAAAGKTTAKWVLGLKHSPPSALGSFVVSGVSALTDVRDRTNGDGSRADLRLVPAVPSLRFAELEYDHIHFVKPDPDAPRRAMTEHLSGGLDTIGESFDLVIFDCPPGFTTLAQAAISLADAIISPVFEDLLSVWSLKDFREFGLKKTLNCWDPARHRILFSRVGGTGAKAERIAARSQMLGAGFAALNKEIPDTKQAHRWSHRAAPDSVTSFSNKYGRISPNVILLGSEVAAFLKSVTPKER